MGLLQTRRVWSGPILWALYSYTLTILLAVVGNTQLEPFQDTQANQAGRALHPVKASLADAKPYLVVLLVVLAGVPALVNVWRSAQAKHHARVDFVKRHLRMVQHRSFPTVDGITTRARISLFERTKESTLRCVYRTDDAMPQQEWPTSVDRGFVVRAFRIQVSVVAKELDPKEPSDLARYLTETWADEAIFAARSWKGPAMLAIPVIVRPGEQPTAVFLIETLGVRLATSPLYETDVAVCRMLMEES